jgi:chromosome segregation ATPase
MTQRDCIHGSLARSCHICELQADRKTAEARVRTAEAANADLMREMVALRERAERAEDRHTDVANRLILAEAELTECREGWLKRDDSVIGELVQRAVKAEADLATLTDWTNKRGHWYTAELERIKADLDRLAATVETVRTMALAPHWLTDSRGEGHESVYAANILRALADPADYPRCRECGKWKEKP